MLTAIFVVLGIIVIAAAWLLYVLLLKPDPSHPMRIHD